MASIVVGVTLLVALFCVSLWVVRSEAEKAACRIEAANSKLWEVEARLSTLMAERAAMELRSKQLGPIESLSAQVDAYRDKADEARLQLVTLRAVAVAATEVVRASGDQILLPPAIYALRKAIGSSVWLPVDPSPVVATPIRRVASFDEPTPTEAA